jgi:transglutaminase-like putative cysteine protease/HAMP domain-containing protein
MLRFLFGISSLLLGAGVAVSAQRPYRIGPPPSWVKIHQPNLTAPSQATEGWEYVLSDRQEYAGPSTNERYWHMAYRVLDEGAVKENSQLEISFDSTYQELILHSARVLRGGRVIDQLKPARMHVAQRETQLEYQIFDGSLSVVVLLEDVRRGDVIEYSFTRRGSNPVFRGHFMTWFRVQDNVPTHQQYFRLVWHRDRPPHIRPYRTELQPSIMTTGSAREYEWSGRNVPALDVEKNLPDWFDPFPAVQVSDFASWRDVAAWGDSLFPDGELPPALRDPIARIRASSESPERWTIQALRFVQDEIRYMGVEIGVNSHRPYSPAVVTQRRYGDCKDKTLLLITMLRALGITARPALVSTTYREHVSDFHPTAGVFDHAIVQVELNGREHWIDPSALYERGDLGDLAASYGAALVLGGRSDSLVPMRAPRRPEPLTDIVVSFDIGGVGQPTTMRVDTRYIGSTANSMRSSVSRSSRKELQQSYAEYYAKLYPSIRSEQEPLIEDDQAANVLRFTERYTIPDFWTGDSAEGHVAKFEPLELSNAMPAATTTERRMPLAINHPAHIRYTINARLQEGWSIASENARIATAVARFFYGSKVTDKVLTLSYEYETLADHVMPAAATAHIKDMARAWDMLVYRITPPGAATRSAGGGHVNWSVLLVALFASVIACFAAVRVSRAQIALAGAAAPSATTTSVPIPAARRHDEPVALGGWLILVGFGVTLSPFRMLVTLSQTLPSYGAATWANLTTPGAANYHPGWAPILMFELIGNIAMLVFSVLLTWLFYRRKRQFPIVFIWVVLLSWLFVAADHVLASLVPVASPEPTNWPRQVAGLLVALIWVAYMRRSRRVRNTFVN